MFSAYRPALDRLYIHISVQIYQRVHLSLIHLKCHSVFLHDLHLEIHYKGSSSHKILCTLVVFYMQKYVLQLSLGRSSIGFTSSLQDQERNFVEMVAHIFWHELANK